MANEATPARLPEFTRQVPPGWKPGLDDYPFKLYIERLHLWWRITPVQEDEAGPLIASRLMDRAFSLAMNLTVVRDGITHKGDAALSLPRQRQQVDINGVVIQEESAAGAGHLMARLKECFEIHDDDKQGDTLDKFFEVRRGNSTLQEFLINFREKYDDAESKAGLTISRIALTHLLFKWSGLPSRRIADIKLHFNGDLSRFDEIYSMLHRIAKQEMHTNHNHYGDVYFEEQNDDDYALEYYNDYDNEETAEFCHDQELGLHYREYFTEETQEIRYGAYDDSGIWYEEEEIEDFLDSLDLEMAYQLTGFRPKFRFPRRGKGKGKSRKGFGKFRKGFGKRGKGKGKSNTFGNHFGGKNKGFGKNGKGKGHGGAPGCSICGSKWHRSEDCPANRSSSSTSGSTATGLVHGNALVMPPTDDKLAPAKISLFDSFYNRPQVQRVHEADGLQRHQDDTSSLAPSSTSWQLTSPHHDSPLQDQDAPERSTARSFQDVLGNNKASGFGNSPQ
jgi:hypothetical protein